LIAVRYNTPKHDVCFVALGVSEQTVRNPPIVAMGTVRRSVCYGDAALTDGVTEIGRK